MLQALNKGLDVAEGYQDKRVERSKAAVLADTDRQLTQGGMSGVSIDDVARVSGVAKTTIYRHWPSRSALLIDACSREQLRTAAWPCVLHSIIDAAERDAEIATMQSSLHANNMASFYAVVKSAKERGEMSPDKPAADLIAATFGPLFYRRWFSKEEIDDRFVDAVVDAAVNAATGKRAEGGAAYDPALSEPLADRTKRPRRRP